MAGLLNTVYLVVATLVAVGGLAVVATTTTDLDRSGSRWVNWSMLVVGALFLLALAAGFVS